MRIFKGRGAGVDDDSFNEVMDREVNGSETLKRETIFGNETRDARRALWGVDQGETRALVNLKICFADFFMRK